jgi:ferredoxin-thioredoxin reductase catalytic subunit
MDLDNLILIGIYMINKIKIYRKEGWKLNDNDIIVTSILNKALLKGGICPCALIRKDTNIEDKMCPCKDYREYNMCHCQLYVKE